MHVVYETGPPAAHAVPCSWDRSSALLAAQKSAVTDGSWPPLRRGTRQGHEQEGTQLEK